MRSLPKEAFTKEDGSLSRQLRDTGTAQIEMTPTRTAFVVARAKVPYSELGPRQQRRRHTTATSILQLLNMDDEHGLASMMRRLRHVSSNRVSGSTDNAFMDASLAELRKRLRQLPQDNELGSMLSLITGPVAEVLMRANWASHVSPTQAAALAIFRDLYERELETIKRYMGGIPGLHRVCAARKKLIAKCVPKVH